MIFVISPNQEEAVGFKPMQQEPIMDSSDATTKRMNDSVNNPSHYNKDGIECIDAIKASLSEEEYKGYLRGNLMKYVWRHRYKGHPEEDLRKAQWYLNRLIKEWETNPS
jgi:hypothetical protein